MSVTVDGKSETQLLLEVLSRQAQEIGEIRKGMDHQTMLTRFVLVVALVGIVAAVLIALFL